MIELSYPLTDINNLAQAYRDCSFVSLFLCFFVPRDLCYKQGEEDGLVSSAR
jgi:hypothetical protein